jgi:hypothetical protein
MTMLTHTGGPFKQARYSSSGGKATGSGTANAHMAMIRRFCRHAVAILALGGVATAIVAVKAAIYFWRFPL